MRAPPAAINASVTAAATRPAKSCGVLGSGASPEVPEMSVTTLSAMFGPAPPIPRSD